MGAVVSGPDSQGAHQGLTAAYRDLLAELCERHGVPGAQLGILRMDPGAPGGAAQAPDIGVAVHGSVNLRTGAPVTPDSIFQIGSITKIYTTTLLMRLIEAGTPVPAPGPAGTGAGPGVDTTSAAGEGAPLTLDTPVRDIVQELKLRDPRTRAELTVRHLLTHTSGIDGDLFVDTGRGDDCLQKYLDVLAEAAQIHPVGAMYSYCNSGFSLAGLIIERLTDKGWDTALRESLLDPLGLDHSVTLPEDAILLGDVAVGHEDIAGATSVIRQWHLPRSSGPAGAVVARAADVLAFAYMHMAEGEGATGARVLGAGSVADMQTEQVAQPDRGTSGDARGLGWVLSDWNGEFVYGHDGGTMGQAAYLRIHPDSGTAVVLLTNGGNGQMVYEELFERVFADLAGIAKPCRVAPPEDWPDRALSSEVAAELTGAYVRAEERIEVTLGPETLRIRQVDTSPFTEVEDIPVATSVLAPLGSGTDGRFARYSAGLGAWSAVTFLHLPDGSRYVHTDGRATPLVEG
ncbi:serine hydrolase domain-containing protein [Brevibacterium moorei]|uniref:serine hydrolase domain-containing protein n=1 Tax=Brevibacterium moorei TaxID=2968457 RepID=UPI00211BE9C0|nr:serine hydrolase domain-containing protein [Brevibacterium sp. 68QC2CO]MCQ9385770.1 beta-lactamase family protein [Brevibacterium sp. 68QC2CO]